MLIELGKYGLGKRDIVPNVNFFTKVAVDDDGNLRFVPQVSPERHVSLRAEMDVLVVLSNTPHLLDPSPTYAPKPLALTLHRGAPRVADDDVCRMQCPQNARGFALTEDYNLSL